MARSKTTPPQTIPLPPDGETKERRLITVAHYWPDDGYGCTEGKFETAEAAVAYAKTQAPRAEATGKAVMHVIETWTKTTVVRS